MNVGCVYRDGEVADDIFNAADACYERNGTLLDVKTKIQMSALKQFLQSNIAPATTTEPTWERAVGKKRRKRDLLEGSKEVLKTYEAQPAERTTLDVETMTDATFYDIDKIPKFLSMNDQYVEFYQKCTNFL